MMTIDEAITHAREKAKEKRKEMQCKTCKLFVRSDLHPLQGYCLKNEFRSIEIDSWSKVCSEYVPREMCKCAEEHEQIAEWLEELKVYQQHEVICHKGYNAGYEKGYADGSLSVTSEIRNKVIDDFSKALLLNHVVDKSVVRRIAGQLKAGGENG